ncbi:MAG: hypothetical protein AB8G05_24110 [Oligoflexales bacterium]
MKKFESILSLTVSIIFSLNSLAIGCNKPESMKKESSEMINKYASEDQDLLIVPWHLDLLARSHLLQDKRKHIVKSASKKKGHSKCRISIYQTNGSLSKNGPNTDDALLFFDTENSHLAEDTPKKAEEEYLTTLLIASLMDELF